jgi:hypothetical protein
VVLRKTTVSNWARLAVVKAFASSVAVTVKLLAAPRSRIVWIPTGIASWRKPAVLENTSTSYGASAAAAGPLVQAMIVAVAAATARTDRIMFLMSCPLTKG